MKPFLLGMTLLLLANVGFTQTLSGSMQLSGFKSGASFSKMAPVDLFAQFKANKFSLGFSFKTGTTGYVLFDMKTTVKHKGVVIGSSTRPGWPWLPGDTFMPAEAFDFVPLLQKHMARTTPTGTYLPAGEYEIILHMVPSSGQDVKGSIMPVTMKFIAQ